MKSVPDIIFFLLTDPQFSIYLAIASLYVIFISCIDKFLLVWTFVNNISLKLPMEFELTWFGVHIKPVVTEREKPKHP